VHADTKRVGIGVCVCIVGGARDPFNGPHVVILLSSDGLTVSVSRLPPLILEIIYSLFSYPFNRVRMHNNDIIIIIVVYYTYGSPPRVHIIIYNEICTKPVLRALYRYNILLHTYTTQ